MLRITHIEEIEGLVLLLPGLVRKQEQRSFDYAASAGAWLDSLEKAFTSSRLYQAGYIATLRSSIVATTQGQLPAGIEFRGRPTRAKVLNAVTSQALQRAAEIASTLIAEHRPRLAEAERVAQQIIAVAFSRGLIVAREPGAGITQYLQMLRRSLATSGDLEGALVHLEGLVGPHDTLVLLDRALVPYSSRTHPGGQN